MTVAWADPAHVRPEIKREVDSFVALRSEIRELERQLRGTFQARMANEGLTIAEYRVVLEALERRD
jgi:hypothetical protein